jgi:hypothetical protein
VDSILVLAQTLYELRFVQLRVPNLVQPNFGAVVGEPFELFEINFAFRLMLFFYKFLFFAISILFIVDFHVFIYFC